MAGLDDVRIHDLRHSFASIGAGTGDSMLIIGALLGHRSAKTTQRYTHLSDHPLRSAAERISTEIARHLGETTELAAVVGKGETEMFEVPERFEREPNPVLGSVIRARWLDTRAAAERLGFTVGTMQTYRWMGTGPVFRKIGRTGGIFCRRPRSVARGAAPFAQRPFRCCRTRDRNGVID